AVPLAEILPNLRSLPESFAIASGETTVAVASELAVVAAIAIPLAPKTSPAAINAVSFPIDDLLLYRFVFHYSALNPLAISTVARITSRFSCNLRKQHMCLNISLLFDWLEQLTYPRHETGLLQ